jgi:hypothetical protein
MVYSAAVNFGCWDILVTVELQIQKRMLRQANDVWAELTLMITTLCQKVLPF